MYRHVRADITGKWHDIGVELFDVEDEPVLNTIKINNPGNADQCTAEMLQLWRDRQPDASWNQLIEAFRAPNIKLEVLALKIEKMLSEGKHACILATWLGFFKGRIWTHFPTYVYKI